MTEEQVRGLAAWNAIGHDPDLLEGITVGQMGDLIEALAMVGTEHPSAMRDAPIGLVIRLSRPIEEVSEMLGATRELLRVKSLRDALTTRAKEQDGASEG